MKEGHRKRKRERERERERVKKHKHGRIKTREVSLGEKKGKLGETHMDLRAKDKKRIKRDWVIEREE